MRKQHSLRIRSVRLTAWTLSLLSLVTAQPLPPITSVLKVHPQNARYFTDEGDQAIYLTGSHSWYSLIDKSPSYPPEGFDFTAYLDFLETYHHNFIRLWYSEFSYGDSSAMTGPVEHYIGPHPWPRTGPGEAIDGQPKFDLEQFNEAYFDRLEARVSAAQERGIYVGVMLFEGWAPQFADMTSTHPFDRANNVNDLHYGDDIRDIHTLINPAVTAVQKAYVRKVIDTVNAFDNVIYEVANEAGDYSTEWQYYMIRLIKEYEATLPKQHLVGMTFQHKGGRNRTLFESPADWISPGKEDDYRNNPPPADGRKVILTDTDHLWGANGGDHTWVWKSFTRGLHPIFMDYHQTPNSYEKAEEVRLAMGHTLMLARRVDLAAMTPQPSLASSRYVLASEREYIVYTADGNVRIDLSATPSEFAAEWFEVGSGTFREGETVEGGGVVELAAPFEGEAVLYLLRSD